MVAVSLKKKFEELNSISTPPTNYKPAPPPSPRPGKVNTHLPLHFVQLQYKVLLSCASSRALNNSQSNNQIYNMEHDKLAIPTSRATITHATTSNATHTCHQRTPIHTKLLTMKTETFSLSLLSLRPCLFMHRRDCCAISTSRTP